MKQLKISAFVLALVACAPLAAFAQSVAGDWEFTLDTPQGASTVNVKLVQDGAKITGNLSSPMGSVDLAGTATGADWKATGNVDAGGMALEIGFTGRVAGDTQSGSVKFGDFGEFPFTGKRSGGATPAASVAPAAAVPAAASAGGVSGTWAVALNIPGAGEIPVSVTLAQAGDKLTGMVSSQVGGDVPLTGTITGSSLKIAFTAQTATGDVPVTMTGTLAAGVFTGKADISGMGEADWTGKRAN